MTNIRAMTIALGNRILERRTKQKLYCLKIRRFAKLFQNVSGKTQFFLFCMGRLTYNAINNSENFENLSSDRQRVMAFMWILLTQHNFTGAARLLTHAVHKYDMSSSWFWQVAFHIFNVMKVP
ncbi:unnamed protein product, partial [Hymenolepis diminuta]